MKDLKPVLLALKKDKERVIFTSPRGAEVLIIKTMDQSDDDFAVEFKIPERRFRPTHVRLLIDLYLKWLSDRANFEELYRAIEDAYVGGDPDDHLPKVNKLKFGMLLDDPSVSLYCSQLLMIEQDLNRVYKKEFTEEDERRRKRKSSVNPPRAFLMAFIKWIQSGESEIDEIVTAAVRNWRPNTKYIRGLPSPTQEKLV